MCPDGLGDGAGVAEAVGVDGSDDEEVNGVGVKPHYRVPLLPHVVGHRLPGAAHRLAVFQKQTRKKPTCPQKTHGEVVYVCRSGAFQTL